MNEDDKLIKDHSYDGIKELDNPLPKWWLITFYITMVYGAGYFVYYQVLSGPSSDQQLKARMTEIAKVQEANKPQVDMIMKKVNRLAMLNDAKGMKKARKIYKRKCRACHGKFGEGGIGPNLTDAYWIHSKGDYKGVLNTIREGVPSKGMQPWKDTLSEKQQVYLAEFVMQLQGTNPDGQKGPDGDLIKRE